jgi:uncharacterized protein (TIGR00251 family)
MPDIRVAKDRVTFRLKVKPRSSRERLSLNSAGELQLEVHAPATDGEANEACCRYLARKLGVPPRTVTIDAGQKSRHKLIRMAAPGPSEAQEIARRLSRITEPGES